MENSKTTEPEESKDAFLIFLQYRGKCTETWHHDIHKTGLHCKVVFTLRKLKTITPSLKEPVEKSLKSGIVYKISCPRCNSCYIGQTGWHLQTRLREHSSRKGPAKEHIAKCETAWSEDNVSILSATSQGEVHLLTLEALWIREIKPDINTKDEYRSRELTIKF